MNDSICLWNVRFYHHVQQVGFVEWFATEAEAQARYDELVLEGYDTDEEDGELGVLLAPDFVWVDISPAGILRFAKIYAAWD